ncbi:MAG: caspase family protein, partial [Bacteroidetes bacterium]|nr:caspase family protein [Bacteroidota bacterium]
DSSRKKVMYIELTEREGGIGKISVFINGKEVIEDARSHMKTKSGSAPVIKIKLKRYKDYFISGKKNQISVKAYNEEGYLSSQLTSKSVITKHSKRAKTLDSNIPTNLFAIIIGTADYRGDKLDLKYADKDADKMAKAIEMTANRLFGKDHVFMKVLTTSKRDKDQQPTKENIENVFNDFADKAGASDVLLIYFSGHGVNYGGSDGLFYYLTKDIESGDLTDPGIRKRYAISTNELTEWIKAIPAQKQVMIIDACASGKLVEDILASTKDVSSSQIRALERMKDRTGMFIITGSAADMVSYEASHYGQSLLTYSILYGINGDVPKQDGSIDIATLFQYAADHVPDLASDIGGIQRPVVSTPFGGNSFDIGIKTSEMHIDLEEVKPIFIRSNFQEQNEYADVLQITSLIDQNLYDISFGDDLIDLVFSDVSKYEGTYSIKGRYLIDNNGVIVTAKLYLDSRPMGDIKVEGSKNDLDALVKDVITQAYALVNKD